MAGFVTLGVMLGLWIIGGLSGGASGGDEVVPLPEFRRPLYNNFFQGVLDLGDVVYFVSLTVLALFLGSQVVEARRWR